MILDHLDIFATPGGGRFTVADGATVRAGRLIEGELVDTDTGARTPVQGGIPRFEQVRYAASFGEQWNRYKKVQIDRVSGIPMSAKRLFGGTGWAPDELKGQRVLDVGCGAGRFTDVLLRAGADVVAVDGHAAVEACFSNNGPDARLTVVQANLFNMPFRPGAFDKVFCYGVLQHTPDPRRAFESLIPPLAPGGKLAFDCYRRDGHLDPWKSKYLYRPVTKRLPRKWLFSAVEWFIPRWLPFDTFLKRIPVVRRIVGLVIPCWNFRLNPELPTALADQWSILDTFDALSPAYDNPQRERDVERWMKAAPLADIRINAGGGLVVANAVKAR